MEQQKVSSKSGVSRFRLSPEYTLFSLALAFIFIYGFCIDSPQEIWDGLVKIATSRSILITDYMKVGGAGAMLVNGALAGVFALALVIFMKVTPNGAIIMALWMTVGFGFFGKNVFNMLPLTAGTWLYAKFQRDPFMNYALPALLVATLSPVVSELAFGFDMIDPWLGIVLSLVLGVLTGFIFPMVSAFTVRVHDGYNLYNMGFAGGLIAMILVAGFKAVGITIETANLWEEARDVEMAILLYGLSLMLIAAGFIMGRDKDHIYNLKRIMRSSGRLVSDYYTLYGESSYINMGMLGFMATSLTVVMGISINGATMGGILTIMAFGCFGNHLRNVLPIMLGAILATYVNVLDPNAPSNALAVLFSAGLAPIAGQFGFFWGVLAGFIHVNTVIHTGYMSNGLNLYNNGFAAGFVAMLLVPIIVSIRNRERD